jgi:hypothetical protein
MKPPVGVPASAGASFHNVDAVVRVPRKSRNSGPAKAGTPTAVPLTLFLRSNHYALNAPLRLATPTALATAATRRNSASVALGHVSAIRPAKAGTPTAAATFARFCNWVIVVASLAISGCRDSTAPPPAKPAPPAAASVTPAARSSSDPLAPFAAAYAALDRPVTVDFRQAPLPEVLAELSRQADFPIRLDRQAMMNDPEFSTFDDEFTLDDVLLTMHVSDLPLESALALVLGDSDLYLDLRRDEIVVTSRWIAYQSLQTVTYPIPQALLDPTNGMDEAWLGELICGQVDVLSWDRYGGTTHLHSGPGALVVAHTPLAHRRIARFLAGLRHVVEQREGWSFDEGLPDPTPVKRAIDAALARPYSARARGRPLVDVLSELAREANLNLAIDWSAFQEQDIDPRQEVALEPMGENLGEWLKGLFGSLELATAVRHRTLLVTTKDHHSVYHARAYPVAASALMAANEQGEPLTEMLIWHVNADTWSPFGGPGSVEIIPGGLLVWNDDERHAGVRWFLDRLEYLANPSTPADRQPLPEAGLDAALQRPISVDLARVPFREAIEVVVTAASLPPAIWTDRRGRPLVRFVNEPVTLECDQMPAWIALDLICDRVGTDWNCSPQSLTIGFLDRYSIPWSKYDARFYRVGSLQQGLGGDRESNLIDLIASHVIPECWADVGGPGEIHAWQDGLIVTNDYESQVRVRHFLRGLRALTERSANDDRCEVLTLSPLEAELRQALATPVRVAGAGRPLRDVLDDLLRQADWQRRCYIPDGLHETLARSTTLAFDQLPLGQALHALLGEQDLDWFIRDDVLRIAAADDARDEWFTRFYALPGVRGATFDARQARAIAAWIASRVESGAWLPDWDGQIDIVPGGLIFSQPLPVHEQLEQQLPDLCQFIRAGAPADAIAPTATDEGAAP